MYQITRCHRLQCGQNAGCIAICHDYGMRLNRNKSQYSFWSGSKKSEKEHYPFYLNIIKNMRLPLLTLLSWLNSIKITANILTVK